MKLLIAVDDPHCRRLLRGAAETLDCEGVIEVAALEAIERVQQGPELRIVIADTTPSDPLGVELCRRIRKRDEAHYAYVILLADADDRVTRLGALAAGADDVLSRPLEIDEVSARLAIATRIVEMQSELVRRAVELAGLKARLERRNARLVDLASRDPLTGLSNRRDFDLHLRSALATDGLAVILLDLDHFKPYNDRFGHPAGDEVLVEVARLLRESVRDRDLVARYGGEEFAVLCRGCGVEEGRGLAERLRVRIRGHNWPRRSVTASFGVAAGRPGELMAAELVDRADRALYRAKDAGRDRVEIDDSPTERRANPLLLHDSGPMERRA